MVVDVLVATHKKVNVNIPEYCRLIQVGSALHDRIDGYLQDDAAEPNISAKNESYCELTALYYLWKHSDADIKGLFHYRRCFYNGQPLKCNRCRVQKRAESVRKFCITEEQIKEYLANNDAIVEIPYFPGLWDARHDLEQFCYPHDIEKLDKIIETYYPEYLESYLSVMKSHHLSYCNMIIAKKDIIDEYCEWLFEVLGRCEKVIEIDGYDAEHKRIYGYFAEVLMNVYLRKNQIREKRVPIFYVFEYTGVVPTWIRWQKIKVTQDLGKLNICLPTKNTEIIKMYYHWLQNGGDGGAQ